MPRSTPRARRRGPAVLVLLALVVAAGLFVWWHSSDAVTNAAADTSATADTGAPTERATTDPGSVTSSAPASSGTASVPSGTAGSSSSGDEDGGAVDVTGVPTGATQPSSTQVVLTYVSFDAAGGGVIAGGYEAPVVEDGGTCTLTLTRGGVTVTATSPASADATTSVCDNLTVDRSELAAGTWTAVLGYQSGAAHRQSVQKTVEVPA